MLSLSTVAHPVSGTSLYSGPDFILGALAFGQCSHVFIWKHQLADVIRGDKMVDTVTGKCWLASELPCSEGQVREMGHRPRGHRFQVRPAAV